MGTASPTRTRKQRLRDAFAPLEEDAPPEPDGSSDTVELVRQLAELETCDALEAYRARADQVEDCVGSLLRCKNCFDAYRAALVFCRHGQDSEGRSAPLRAEAQDRLRRLLLSDDLLAFVIAHATETDGLTSVQATQILVAYGSGAVAPLLDLYAHSSDEALTRVTAVLIALGDATLPAVVEELRSGSAERVRRAARLLGALQHPSAIEFLVDALRTPNPRVCHEVAQALAAIGSPRATKALIDALEAGSAAAETAARCLGRVRGRPAVQALARAVADSSTMSDGVRREAVRSLGRIGGSEALDVLTELLERRGLLRRRKTRALRIVAAQALGRIGGPRAREVLERNTLRGEPAVRSACQHALDQLDDRTA